MRGESQEGRASDAPGLLPLTRSLPHKSPWSGARVGGGRGAAALQLLAERLNPEAQTTRSHSLPHLDPRTCPAHVHVLRKCGGHQAQNWVSPRATQPPWCPATATCHFQNEAECTTNITFLKRESILFRGHHTWSEHKEMDPMANKLPTWDTTKWNLGDAGDLGKWVTSS